MTSVYTKIPENVRIRIESWQFWMVLAYFAQAIVVVWLFSVYSQQHAQIEARKQACIQSAPLITQFNTGFGGFKKLAETLENNSGRLLAATATNDPQYQARLKNWQDIADAQGKIENIPALPVTEPEDC